MPFGWPSRGTSAFLPKAKSIDNLGEQASDQQVDCKPKFQSDTTIFPIASFRKTGYTPGPKYLQIGLG